MEQAPCPLCGAHTRLRGEIEEYANLTGRQARLLTLTANALKGEPPDNMWHDWSDLPAVAARQSELLKDASNLLQRIKAAHPNIPWAVILEIDGIYTAATEPT